MGRVAFLGDETSGAGFRPLGLDVFSAEEPRDARGLWDEVAGGAYEIVFVTEPVFREVEDLVAALADTPLPAVTVIPSVSGSDGRGAERLRRAIERALGTTVPMTDKDA